MGAISIPEIFVSMRNPDLKVSTFLSRENALFHQNLVYTHVLSKTEIYIGFYSVVCTKGSEIIFNSHFR